MPLEQTVIDAVNEGANRPGIAFNAERNEYLVAYTVNPTNIAMVRLDAARQTARPPPCASEIVKSIRSRALRLRINPQPTSTSSRPWTDFGWSPPFSTDQFGPSGFGNGFSRSASSFSGSVRQSPDRQCEQQRRRTRSEPGHRWVHADPHPVQPEQSMVSTAKARPVPSRAARTYAVPHRRRHRPWAFR